MLALPASSKFLIRFGNFRELYLKTMVVLMIIVYKGPLQTLSCFLRKSVSFFFLLFK